MIQIQIQIQIRQIYPTFSLILANDLYLKNGVRVRGLYPKK